MCTHIKHHENYALQNFKVIQQAEVPPFGGMPVVPESSLLFNEHDVIMLAHNEGQPVELGLHCNVTLRTTELKSRSEDPKDHPLVTRHVLLVQKSLERSMKDLMIALVNEWAHMGGYDMTQ
ncbi:hypothetical protein AZE42_08303 [Rhizopogon vesiculosus]|uniref:Uncharacterized protein n=1 Tax=Rhizopogon vesiculosus TaxID=180088 RepID=A0A1J8Q4S8_9AGAM|nr:hypothetical protein AZE42_08303 [Rhizopogon vesiculosus]